MSKVLFLIGYGPGVGDAVARRFAREGYAVGAVARTAKTLTAVETLGKESGVTTAVATADAGDESALRSAIQTLTDGLGTPTVLVYNAAAVTQALPSALGFETLMKDFSVSVGGALVAAQAVLPLLQAAGKGSVLFTGGGFALQPYPALASLGIGKAGLRNLAQSLHQELAGSEITVGVVTIGGTVGSGPAFMPDAIAEHFWAMHGSDGSQWERWVG